MGIALQVFVNLSKLLESQGASACDCECVKWMVDLVKQDKPALLNVSDPDNIHTMVVSIVALDLAAGKLSDDGIGRRRRREINGALAQAIRMVDEKRLVVGMGGDENELIKAAKRRLTGSGASSEARPTPSPQDLLLQEEQAKPVAHRNAWMTPGEVTVRDIDAVRDLRMGDGFGFGDEVMARLAMPSKDEIRTENLDPSVQAIISENAPANRIDWIGLTLIALALCIPPVGLFMAGAAWAMEQRGRSMVLSALAVAGSFAWAVAI